MPLATVGTKLPNGAGDQAGRAARRGQRRHALLARRSWGCPRTPRACSSSTRTRRWARRSPRRWASTTWCFEVNVTPNRADALSHLGIAREVATLTGEALKPPDGEARQEARPRRPRRRSQIRIDDAGALPALRGAGDRGRDGEALAAVDAAAPEGLRRARHQQRGGRHQLRAARVRPAAARVRSRPARRARRSSCAPRSRARSSPRSTARSARSTAEDLLICDRDQPQVLAGVMGGAKSEVTAEDDARAAGVRDLPAHDRAAHGQAPRAAHRVVAPLRARARTSTAVPEALDRAAALMAELGGGTVLRAASTCTRAPKAPRRVTLRNARVAEVLGVAVPAAECRAHPLRAGLHRGSPATTRTATFEVPGARVDVEHRGGSDRGDRPHPRLRHHPRGAAARPGRARRPSVRWRVRGAPAAHGAGGAGPRRGGELLLRRAGGAGGVPGRRRAPSWWRTRSSAEQSVMRTTLLPGLVQNVTRACGTRRSGVRFYELARSYRPDPEGGRARHPVAARGAYEVAGRAVGPARRPADVDEQGRRLRLLRRQGGGGGACCPRCTSTASATLPLESPVVPPARRGHRCARGGRGAGHAGRAAPAGDEAPRRARRACSSSSSTCRPLLAAAVLVPQATPLSPLPRGAARSGGGGAGGAAPARRCAR